MVFHVGRSGYAGTNDPNNRESLWQTRFSTQSPLYQLIRTIISYRKQAQIWQYPQVLVVLSQSTCSLFSALSLSLSPCETLT
jgi:hypothetical protein